MKLHMAQGVAFFFNKLIDYSFHSHMSINSIYTPNHIIFNSLKLHISRYAIHIMFQQFESISDRLNEFETNFALCCSRVCMQLMFNSKFVCFLVSVPVVYKLQYGLCILIERLTLIGNVNCESRTHHKPCRGFSIRRNLQNLSQCTKHPGKSRGSTSLVDHCDVFSKVRIT